MAFRVPEVRLDVRPWFRWSDLTVSPQEPVDVTPCVLLYLTLDYVLCACFFVPKIPYEPTPHVKRRSAMVVCFLQKMLPDNDSH